MTNLEAMRERISRRTYTDTRIEPDTLAQLNARIQAINAASQLSIFLLEDGSLAFNSIRKSYGMFKGVRSILVLKGKKSDAHLREKIGYYGEELVLEATKLGLGTCWVGGTFDKKNPVFQVTAEEELVCVIPVGYVPMDQTLREKLIYQLSHRKTKSIETFIQSDEEIPEWILEGVKAVQNAPSAINSQKVRLTFKNGILSIGVPETYVFDLVDLGIAKLHFEYATNQTFPLGNHTTLA